MENLPPHVLRGVSKEIVSLSQNPPEGITLHLNYDDLTDIQATIIGPGTVPQYFVFFLAFALIYELEIEVISANKFCIFGFATESTPYAGGEFKLKLVLGKDFPAVPPKGFFLTKIFHPNIATSGEICVNALKKDWKHELGLKHILLVRI